MGTPRGVTGGPGGETGPLPRVRLVALTPAAAAAALRGERLLPGGLAVAPDWPDESAAPVLGLAAVGGPDAARDGQWLVVADAPRVDGGAGAGAAGAGAVIGLCGARARDPDGAVEIGYSLAPSARGRGAATAAVGALVQLLAGGPDPSDVVAETGADNRPSRRLLERLGFALEGTGGAGPRRGDHVTLRYRLSSGA